MQNVKIKVKGYKCSLLPLKDFCLPTQPKSTQLTTDSLGVAQLSPTLFMLNLHEESILIENHSNLFCQISNDKFLCLIYQSLIVKSGFDKRC